MFATVESSTAAICSKALFDVTQIWSYARERDKKAAGFEEPCGCYLNFSAV
jgi:hypothetical protein